MSDKFIELTEEEWYEQFKPVPKSDTATHPNIRVERGELGGELHAVFDHLPRWLELRPVMLDDNGLKNRLTVDNATCI